MGDGGEVGGRTGQDRVRSLLAQACFAKAPPPPCGAQGAFKVAVMKDKIEKAARDFKTALQAAMQAAVKKAKMEKAAMKKKVQRAKKAAMKREQEIKQLRSEVRSLKAELESVAYYIKNKACSSCGGDLPACPTCGKLGI